MITTPTGEMMYTYDQLNRLKTVTDPEGRTTTYEYDQASQVGAHTREKRGRWPIPPEYPRAEMVHGIPEEEKICPFGCRLIRIGEEVSEKLDIVPQKIQVIRTIRPKYAGRACEGGEDNGPTVKTAPNHDWGVHLTLAPASGPIWTDEEPTPGLKK